MAFHILNQFPVYWDLAGNLADGGELRFYENESTTPKSVYGGPSLSPDNGSVIAIGSDGRPTVDIWGDGVYRVRLYDANDTLIAEADDVEIPGGDATTIPALVDGYFLSNNGSLLLWVPLIQLPDPTGQDGKMVVADGAGYILQTVPSVDIPDPEIEVGANSFQAGVSTDETKELQQSGTGSAVTGGGKTATATITFATPFAATPTWVGITPTSASNCATANLVPKWAVTALSASAMTVTFSTVTGSTSGDNFPYSNITSNVPFVWSARGTIEVPAP